MNDPISALWLGTEEAHWSFLHNELKLAQMTSAERMKLSLEHQKQKLYDESGENNPFDEHSYMMTRHDNLAVVTVKGELVTEDRWYNRYYGRTSYNEIRNCVVAAANDESIHGIVLDMATPGGQASGIMELSDFMKDVDKKVKPIYTYTGTAMCSGGYWLGCVGRKIYASPMASVGSIGVVMAHQSLKRYYEEMGVDVKVLRSGEFKALGHPLEALSPKAEATMQESLDETYGIFLDHVAGHRGTSVESLKANAAEGRVFLASKGHEVGLVDKLAHFDQALSEISKKVTPKERSQKQSMQFKGDTSMTRKVITEQAQAALASGVTEEEVLQSNELTPEASEETPAVSATETPEAVVAEPTVQEETPAPKVEEPKQETSGISELVAQITELTAEKTRLSMENENLQQKQSLLEGNQSALMTIAREATQRMQVALGSAPADMDKVDASGVISMYQSAQTKFHERFPVGGQAKVPTDEDQQTLKREGPAVSSHLATSGLTL